MSCSAVALIVVDYEQVGTIAMRDHLLFLFSNTCLYLGETGRSLKRRKVEHIRNVKKHGSNIAKHAWDNDHVFDFDSAKIIDTGNFRRRSGFGIRRQSIASLMVGSIIDSISSLCV